MKLKETYVECPYCKNIFNQINIQHLRKHKKTMLDLKTEFPDCKILSDFSVNKMKKKYKETCLEKFGVESTNMLQKVKQKKVDSFVSKYNVSNPSKVSEIKNKKEATWFKKYGVKNPSQCDEIKNKKKKTFITNGHWISDENLPKYRLYRRKVTQMTDVSIRKYFKENEIKQRGRSGKSHSKQIDHIYSVTDGFINNVSPEVVSHICNLRLIGWKENNDKWKRSDTTINELYSLIKEFESEESKREIKNG